MDWIIDADTHITEPADLWTTRLPKKYRELGPRLVRNPDTQWDVWQIGERSPIVPVGFTAIAGWPEPFPSAPRNMDEVPLAAYDATARLDYMDSLGIWAMALYPNVGGFGSQAFLNLKDGDLMLECVRAYNDFLLDWIAPAPERFIPIMATPFWDVDATVAEIERCAKLGHKGILFSGEPQTHSQPILGNRHWDRVWECAQAADLPISFHIGTGNFDGGFTPERIEHHGIGCSNAFTTVGLFLDNGRQITDLLLSGVLPRYPKLRFVSVESGIGFIPFILEAADYAFEYSEVRRERPEFDMLPSEYFARQVYGCFFFEELAPQRLLDRIGVDNIMFETDYPHPVCLYGNVREKIDASLAATDETVRRKLLYENAARLYRVEAPDRAVPAAR